ncbi:molybdenum cofactor biosynthesis protein B [Alteromonas ponticola]|uniref:Molybdenum cofactor biosynthesis protein B n=1 Tax=Alteromonas ponticola TaxID=2720613 RepID=A0ABX1R427_9ALTE|nr:molybdenum cofactor biosynthesis protein B [Alteromonas ponticola]NMH61200.1 molybdenum cofactor biosynthesis protein B [Alteromonas ponticola]
MKLNIAILTVSDTRTRANDKSGDYLQTAADKAGHQVVARQIVADELYVLRAAVSTWIADSGIDVILTTGGTGFAERDVTPEAIQILFDKAIVGFGEVFRQISYDEIGSATVQSRALAGVANNTLIFCMPGSTGACRTAWEKIIVEQLDASFRPCNFTGMIKQGHAK